MVVKMIVSVDKTIIQTDRKPELLMRLLRFLLRGLSNAITRVQWNAKVWEIRSKGLWKVMKVFWNFNHWILTLVCLFITNCGSTFKCPFLYACFTAVNTIKFRFPVLQSSLKLSSNYQIDTHFQTHIHKSCKVVNASLCCFCL